MIKNKKIMQEARKSLEGRWKLAVVTYLVFFLISISIQSSIFILGFIVSGTLYLGLSIFLLSFLRKKEANLMQIFEGFPKFDVALFTYIRRYFYILLWALLFIIPGIIAALKYSQVFFILADNPKMKAKEVLDKSMEMMDGYKWKLFRLYLRFIGWILLSILSLGLGFIWLMPYMAVSRARFYEDIR